MMNMLAIRVIAAIAVVLFGVGSLGAQVQVRTEAGVVAGIKSADGKVVIFKGIPFAAPPVGDLRWKGPQPVARWQGVRKATEFGARCMQARIYEDMVFRDSGPSEDCLYLNVWTPGISANKLPVMVWIYGGGFQAGATSEPRQDGEHLAHQGVVIVSMNYRLGIFGFFSHPGLTAESAHHASGNYGLMDQAAALKWVHENIAAFGGDPNNVTIFGESAGSFAVSALMASPSSKELIHAAIGESGAFFGKTVNAKPLAESERRDAVFAESLGLKSLGQLRGVSAQKLLEASRGENDNLRFRPNIDGYFMPATAYAIYAKGEQAHIPLMAGWNRDEGSYQRFFGTEQVSKENYAAKIRQLFGEAAAEALKLFPGGSDEEVKTSAALLSTADFIALETWKWMEMHLQTGEAAVYRYEFDQVPPPSEKHEAEAGLAYHSAEIEYVLGTLDWKKIPWRPEDYKLSEQMGSYWTNFARSGDPNGPGLGVWPMYIRKSGYQVMHLRPNPRAMPDKQREKFLFLDRNAVKAN
jgi:para-nitrobenzyl esterase